jgi:hypothetical protein
MDLREMRCEGVSWIKLAYYKFQWQALMIIVMDCPVPYNAGRLSTSWATSQELCFMEFVIIS